MKRILIFIIGLLFCISCTNTTQIKYKTEYWVINKIDTFEYYYSTVHQYLPRYEAIIKSGDSIRKIPVHNNEYKLGDTIKIYITVNE